ncbi:hypothetical protein G6O67_003718 [Ophiocordyceps sinensis]|uniref:Uncharacterized protein n=1 Tax=Ophiocordyceps sinensis TaxID=72228 RepID=A0A8H4V6A6_9HYPO|nr:hypothetical protein G6O67_003718 [Ophiocordyceps sinensis]
MAPRLTTNQEIADSLPSTPLQLAIHCITTATFSTKLHLRTAANRCEPLLQYKRNPLSALGSGTSATLFTAR